MPYCARLQYTLPGTYILLRQVQLPEMHQEYDKGTIISQTIVDVFPSDTAESLSQKVQSAEKVQLIDVLNRFTNNLI